MSPKKLLICSPSATTRGGVETIIDDLCRELPKFGWDTVLGLGKGARFNDVAAYRTVHPDQPIRELDATSGTRQGRLEAIHNLIARVQPDVVLSARVFDAYEVVAALKHSSGGPRLAVAIRGYEPGYLYDARLYRDNIDLCVVDGNLLSATCIDWCGLEAEKVVSIPGGVHPAAMPHRSPVSGGPLRIGYVGRLAQSDKRVLDLVLLARYLDERQLSFQLSITGRGPEEPALREQLNSFVSSGRVTFAGWKTREELYRDVYPQLDCIVNFSPSEGVTISGREAMANSVVPVISQFVGLKSEGQYVHETNALTFPVGDIGAAGDSIIRLREEPALLDRLKQNAAASQTGKYSYSGAMKAWAEALDLAMERTPGKGPVPKLMLPPDGRLARIGVSPGVAHRIRSVLRRRMVHSDPGSEWPQASGLMTNEAAQEIMRFATDYEGRSNSGPIKPKKSEPIKALIPE